MLIPEGIHLKGGESASVWRSDSTTVTWGRSLWASGRFPSKNDALPLLPSLYATFFVLFRITKRQMRSHFRLLIFTFPCFLILGGSSLLNSVDPFNATWFLTSIVINLCVPLLSTVVETSLLIRSEMIRFLDDSKRGSKISWSAFITALLIFLLVQPLFQSIHNY